MLDVPLAVGDVGERRRVGHLELLLARRLLEVPGQSAGRLRRSAATIASFLAWRSRTRPRASCTSDSAWRRSSLSDVLGADDTPRGRTGSRAGAARPRRSARTATSRRSRAFICRTGPAISLPSRGAGGGACAAGARPSSSGRAFTSSGHLRSNSRTYFWRSVPTICVVLLIFASLSARVVGERGGDGLRVGDRADDAAHDDVSLLHVELLDVVLHRRRDRLRQAHHHVERVGVRHGVLVAQRRLLREEVLRVLRASSPRSRAPPSSRRRAPPAGRRAPCAPRAAAPTR